MQVGPNISSEVHLIQAFTEILVLGVHIFMKQWTGVHFGWVHYFLKGLEAHLQASLRSMLQPGTSHPE